MGRCGVANLVRLSHFPVVDWDLAYASLAKADLTMKESIGSHLVVVTMVAVLVSGHIMKLEKIRSGQLPIARYQLEDNLEAVVSQ